MNTEYRDNVPKAHLDARIDDLEKLWAAYQMWIMGATWLFCVMIGVLVGLVIGWAEVEECRKAFIVH